MSTYSRTYERTLEHASRLGDVRVDRGRAMSRDLAMLGRLWVAECRRIVDETRDADKEIGR